MEKMGLCDVGSIVGVTTLVTVRGAPPGMGLTMEPPEPSEPPGQSSAGPRAAGAPSGPPRPPGTGQPAPPSCGNGSSAATSPGDQCDTDEMTRDMEETQGFLGHRKGSGDLPEAVTAQCQCRCL